jgi:hypothetical protein
MASVADPLNRSDVRATNKVASQKNFRDEIDAGQCASAEKAAFIVLRQSICRQKASICPLVV